jgi:Cu+-exporting ATPase
MTLHDDTTTTSGDTMVHIPTVPGLEHVDLELTGMTCAACANRIEKKLNKLGGVTATVNYATEKANITFDSSKVSADQLVDAVTSIGYGALLPSAIDDDTPDAAEVRLVDLRRRLVVAIALGVPVLLLSMISALQFRGWQWVALVLATPVAVWSAMPFHTAATATTSTSRWPAPPSP